MDLPRKPASAATLLAAVVAFLLAAPGAAEATTIVNRHWGGGKCLDADPGQDFDGGQVYLWDCNGFVNQQWAYWSNGRIRSRWNGRCLDADPRTNSNGGTVYLWTCFDPPPPQQRWYRRDNGEIASALNGRCLDAAADGGGNPIKVQLWDCWGWANAKWTLDPEIVCSGALEQPRCSLRPPPPRPSPPRPSPPRPSPPPPSSPTPPPPGPAPSPPAEPCRPAPSAGSAYRLQARVRASRAKRSRHRARRSVTVGYGRHVRVAGRLTLRGEPVAGASLCVVARGSAAAAGSRELGAVVTDAGGRFSYRMRSGPSQRVWFVYRPGAAAASVRVRVRAPLSLHASPHSLRTGETVTLRGRLRARPRHRGAIVLLQARRSKRWQTFGTTHTRRKGRFSFDYRFVGTSGAQTYRLRARMPAHHGSAFATGTSRVVAVRVRGR